MAALDTQIVLSGESECSSFVANPLRADKCRECAYALDRHAATAVTDADIAAVLALRSPANRIASWRDIVDRGAETDAEIDAEVEADAGAEAGAGANAGEDDGGDGGGDGGGGAGLWLGGYKACTEKALASMGVGAVVNTAKGLDAFFVKWGKALPLLAAAGIAFHTVEWIDDAGQDIDAAVVDAAVVFIAAHVAAGTSVLVHCAQGKSRSTTLVVAALLLLNPTLSYDHALARVRAARPLAEPNAGFAAALRALAASPRRPARSAAILAAAATPPS